MKVVILSESWALLLGFLSQYAPHLCCFSLDQERKHSCHLRCLAPVLGRYLTALIGLRDAVYLTPVH